MSRVIKGLYVGGVYQADELFTTQCNESEIALTDGTDKPKFGGVITVCYDIPCWCRFKDEEGSTGVDDEEEAEMESDAFIASLNKKYEDLSYFNLHLDHIIINTDGRFEKIKIYHSIIYTNDSVYEPLFKAFQFTYEFIEGLLSQEKSVFVHCMYGMSRSTTIVSSYLMKKWNKRFKHVLKYLRTIHPSADPSFGFTKQLYLYYKFKFNINNHELFWNYYKSCCRNHDTSSDESDVNTRSRKSIDTEGPPPEVSPAVSSSNYQSLKSRATPGDRGDEGGEDVTSSGEPVADLREAEGEVNRRGTTPSGKTSSGESPCNGEDGPQAEADGRTSGGTTIDKDCTEVPSTKYPRYTAPFMDCDDELLLEWVYRCKTCCRVLFCNLDIVYHKPKGKMECSSYFIEPMDWMSGLEEQMGRLDCMGCSSKLGSFSWHGRNCSCGYIQVPGIQVKASKVDKIPYDPDIYSNIPNRHRNYI